MKDLILCVSFAIVIVAAFAAPQNATSGGGLIKHRARLAYHLLKKYNKQLLPYDGGNPLDVSFGLTLTRLRKNRYDELDFGVWMKSSWTDSRLEWDPTDFGGIAQIRLDSDSIWIPDVSLFNGGISWYKSVFLNNPELQRGAKVLIYSSGYTLYIPPVKIVSPCSKDDETFKCKLVFGSWTYSGNMMNITFFGEKQSVDASYFLDAGSWDVQENSAVHVNKRYPCCSEPYPRLEFDLKFKEKSDE